MNNLERLGNHISIPLRADDEGYFGRECPKKDCEGYFKVVVGTGLKDTSQCYCPYCGYTGDNDEFYTKEQLEYARSVAMREIMDAVTKDFKKMEFDVKPKGSFGIGMSLKVKEGPRHPIHWYREKALETYVECSNCTLKYAVYGAFAFCPDCGEHNSLQILEKSLEIAIKTLQLSEASSDNDIKSRLIENALEDCVSSFDGFGRSLCTANANKSTNSKSIEKISFQNLEAAARKTKEVFGLDLKSLLEDSEWNALIVGFQKRHLISHKMGIIDEEYLNKTADHTAILGRKISITAQEISLVGELIVKLAKAFYGNLNKSLTPSK